LSNLAKVNVDFGKGIQKIFNFIDSISFPRIKLINSLSPVHSNDFVYHTKHTRDQLIREDADAFIFAESFFLLSLLTLLLKGVSFILEKLDIYPEINKILAWSYFLVFNVMYFDFQIVIFTELTQSRIFSKKDNRFQNHIFFSYAASCIIGGLMVAEIWQANKIFNQKRKELLNSEEFNTLKKVIFRSPNNLRVLERVKSLLSNGLRYSETLLVDKFTEDMSLYYIVFF
jgi:hypothetical protein